MIVSISCQEWKQQVEVAFKTLKGPMELWWDQYIAWIYFVLCKVMQVMATGNKRKFIQLWQQREKLPNEDDAPIVTHSQTP
jgi:hypothetical protein